MTGVLVWSTVIGLFLRVPTWAGIFLCSLTGASFLFYVALYRYLLVHDPQSLRREHIEAKGEHALDSGSMSVDPRIVTRSEHVVKRSPTADTK